MKKRMLLATLSLAMSSVALAAPTVKGNTISWPDDGWYQVQSEADYSEVCAGGRSCVVGAGSYVVINHTTHQRFRGIVVGGSPSSTNTANTNTNTNTNSNSTVTVNGSTISWPDDGWYQVQSEADYSEVCAGGRSCDVAAGSYVVINHTTHQRFRGIVVGDNTSSNNSTSNNSSTSNSTNTITNTNSSAVTVTGNTISWPDDGWYQVQRADTFESLCGGGLSCEVPDGTYIVINHSSGMRYTGVTVPQGSNSPVDKPNNKPVDESNKPATNEPSNTPVVNAGNGIEINGTTITWPDDGWYQVQRDKTYESLCNGGRSCSVEPGNYIVINHSTKTRTHITVSGGEQDNLPTINADNYSSILDTLLSIYTGQPSYTDALYKLPGFREPQPADIMLDCTDGGTASITRISSTGDPGYGYVFDNCDEEETVRNGSIEVYQFVSDQVIADAYSESNPVSSINLTANTRRLPGLWVAADFDYQVNAPSSTGFAITDGDFSWNRSIGSAGSFDTGLFGQFSYQAPRLASGKMLKAVATDLTVSLSPQETNELQGGAAFLDPAPFANVHPTSGTLEIMAEDGSQVLLNAATGDMLTVSITIENADGVTSLVENWSTWSNSLRTDSIGATR